MAYAGLQWLTTAADLLLEVVAFGVDGAAYVTTLYERAEVKQVVRISME